LKELRQLASARGRGVGIAESRRREADRRQKALLFKLGVGAAVAVALVVAGLAIRSSMRASTLAKAEAKWEAEAERIAAAKAKRSEGLRRHIAEAKAETERIAAAEAERILSQAPRLNTIGMQFKLLPAGSFTMGDANGSDIEAPHPVTLTQPFELGVYEVTQEQYEAVMGTNPSVFKGAKNPVEKVSWEDAVEFCRKLSALPEEKAAGRVYRLPTEAEWEYACRAGATTRYSFGDVGSRQLSDYAWFGNNSGDRTIDAAQIWENDEDNYVTRIRVNNCRSHRVGQKKPNPWGLHDMHGNVLEWCQDWYGTYPSGSVTNPTGPSSGSNRVYRGGSWGSFARYCRSGSRSKNNPRDRVSSLGFRVALVESSDGGLLSKFEQTAGAFLESKAPDSAIQTRSMDTTIVKSPRDLQNSIGMDMKLIPAGEFTMGDFGRQVTLTEPFYLGVYEVTQAQYERVMGTNPSKFKGAKNPVEEVSWTKAVEFCRKLSALPEEKAAGHVYRLPTDAEWEYACRAGTTTKYSFGDDENQLGAYAWCRENSGRTTHPVGQKKPNAWGLYDMHGNVWESCQDWYAALVIANATDPTGPSTGSARVGRGGGWNDISGNCRSAIRRRSTPGLLGSSHGFRVLRSSVK
jgi:formylglycine-generating enzyme required for sulfatase activity